MLSKDRSGNSFYNALDNNVFIAYLVLHTKLVVWYCRCGVACLAFLNDFAHAKRRIIARQIVACQVIVRQVVAR